MSLTRQLAEYTELLESYSAVYSCLRRQYNAQISRSENYRCKLRQRALTIQDLAEDALQYLTDKEKWFAIETQYKKRIDTLRSLQGKARI